MHGGGEAQISVFKLFQWSSVVIIQNNSICQHYSAFTVHSGFQLLFKYSTMSCTTDHLTMILVVLKDEPIRNLKQHQHHFARRRHIF